MIIDIHGHVSAPPELYAYQSGLLASRGAHGRGKVEVSDERIEEALSPHLARLDAAGTDLQLISPRPFRAMHWAKPERIVRYYTEATNDLIARQVKLHPARFRAVAGLPQSVGVSPQNCVEELERCVRELGFVGCQINPDPGERGGDETAPLGDEYWYPLYEKMVELGVVGLIHSAGCQSSRLTYSLHFINEESIAVLSLANSRVFEDFPTLKLVVAHGGGAIPYQLGRFASTRFRRGGERFEDAVRRLRYDTCLYTKPALELLFRVIGTDHCLFGTESPGVGSAKDPQTGRELDDLKPVIESIGWLGERDRRRIFEENARALYRLTVPEHVSA